MLYSGFSGKKNFYNSQETGLAKAMTKLGYSVVIFSPNTEIRSVTEEQVEDKITLVHCPAKCLGVHSRYDWNIIKKYCVDIIQIGADNQIFFPSLALFCRKNNMKFYNYIGTVESDSSKYYKRWIMKLLFRRNLKIYKHSQCFVKTRAVCEKLKQAGVEKLNIMPVGLDISVIPEVTESSDALKEKLNIPSDKTVILFVGRIDEYKNPLEIVALMKNLPDKYYYIIIGTGTLDLRLQTEIDNVLRQEQYQWIKEIPNRDIHSYYAVSDFLVNFNRKEIFGMSILEAMYHGCTVIANHAPGPDMIIKNEETGYLVHNTLDMLEYLGQERKIEKKRLKAYILRNFTWDISANIVHKWICAQDAEG